MYISPSHAVNRAGYQWKKRAVRPCEMRQTAFTIVELLVVIAVIGVLLSLVLPAVQAAREASRRVSCQSNLRQIAVATSGFVVANRRFPPGQCGGNYGFGPDSRSWSWLARLLPYLELEPVYDEGGIPTQTLRDSRIADRRIGVFLCASDSDTQGPPRIDAGNLAGFSVGHTNYKAVSGANWGADESQGLSDIGTSWPNPGTNGSNDGHSRGDGIMWRNDITWKLGPQNVTDGLSKTLMIGEDVPEKNRWCSWPYANNAYGTCAIPPNFTCPDTNWWPDTHSFRSNHPNGLNFALADGSVHFIEDTISLDVYRALATRAGKESVQQVGSGP